MQIKVREYMLLSNSKDFVASSSDEGTGLSSIYKGEGSY
jgi:hypothetical protein